MATTSAEELRDEVRRRYAESARAVSEGSSPGCGSGSCCESETDAVNFGEALYDVEQRGGDGAAGVHGFDGSHPRASFPRSGLPKYSS